MGCLRQVKVVRGALLALALLSSACAPLKSGSQQRAIVIFTNEALEQADVYAVISGVNAVRLGTVSATRTDTLYVPRSVTDRAGQSSIVARIIARTQQPSTGPLSLMASDVIRVRLSPDGRNLFVLPPR